MTDSQTMYGGKGAISVAECCVVVDSVDRKSILSITRAVELLPLTSGEPCASIYSNSFTGRWWPGSVGCPLVREI